MAICDIDPVRIQMALDIIKEKKQPKPIVFQKDEYDYRNLLKLDDLQAVIISTPWLWHAQNGQRRHVSR